MEFRMKKLQKQLVALGYNYIIKEDAVLLVEKLVDDIIETTESLRKYMRIAQEALEERDTLKFGAEPYKCDNAKLTQQCNDLHLTLIEAQESHAKEVKDLKKSISKLEKDKEELITSNKKQRERIRELEAEASRRGVRHSSTNILQGAKSKSTSNICSKKKSEFDSAMALTEQKVTNLTKEVNKLKQQQLDLCAFNDELKQKLTHREKEIHRLNQMLQGGRPLETLKNECCYKDIQKQLIGKQDEINFLQKTNSEFEMKLKDARNKQHDAMKHALQLAERNSQLERELRDIDQMALAVEQECNNSIKTNDAKVKKLQERLQCTMIEVQNLEKELHTLRIDKEQFKADLDAANIEKRHLQGVLETALQDKKALSDRINNLTIIEQDLNLEIDRLVQQTANQTRTIADLKGQLLAQQVGNDRARGISSGNELSRTRVSRTKSPPLKTQTQKENQRPSKQSMMSVNKKKSTQPVTRGISPPSSPEKRKTCENFEYLERIKSERDFYMREFKALQERIRKDEIPQRLNVCVSNTNENLNKMSVVQGNDTTDRASSPHLNSKIRDLQEHVSQLQFENQSLSKEKHSLLARLEDVRDYTDATEYLTMKASSKRLERERDILKADVDRLEEERNSFKNRLKVTSDMHTSEIDKYKKLLNASEEQIRRLEKERYDVLHNQGSRQATISNLEDHCETLKEQLKACQDELIHQKTIYSQLKVLHEQTDRALADSQSQLVQLEKQLSVYEQKHDVYDNKTMSLNNDITRLKDNIDILTKNLMDVEREKDNLLMQLDEKTEKIASLESSLKGKNEEMEHMRMQTSDLRQKFGSTLDERNSRDSQLKCKNNEIAQLKRDLEAALKTKENVIQENKRLQEELSECIMENRKVRTELEVSKRQVADLKMQLQHYCAEVKRIEDLMTQKEVERSEMLDQFRSLSNEASALENSNITLESEATQTRVQLSVALDHAGELEQLIMQQKSLISGYEKQIAELTSQLASMEMKAQYGQLQSEKVSLEISTLRDLCAKLDKQKDDLQKQVADKEFIATKARAELEAIRRNQEMVNMTLEKEQSSTRGLENLLSDTRHQLAEQRLNNEDLQREVTRLTNQVSEMEQNLLKVRYLTHDLVHNLCGKEQQQQQQQQLMRPPQNQNLSPIVSEATTMPSEISDYSEPLETQEESREATNLPVSAVSGDYDSSSTSSNIKIDEFRRQVTNYSRANAETATGKFRVTKVKVTSFSQTNR